MNNSTLPVGRSVVRDSCGRIMDLVYENNSNGDWHWITRVSFPVLLALGTLGNVYGIISGWIHYKNSQRIFLIGMCSASLLYLWNMLIILLGTRTWESDDAGSSELYAPFYTPTAGFFLYLDQILYMASQWILLMFCLERCVAVTFPLFHYTNKHRLFGGVTVTVIFVFSAIVGVLSPVLYYWNLNATGTLELKQPVRKIPYSLYMWKEVDTWWEFIFTSLVYVTILVCNLLLVRSLQRNRRHMSIDSSTTLQSAAHSTNSSYCSESSHNQNPNRQKMIVTNRCVPNATRTQVLLGSSLFYLITQSLKVAMCFLVILARTPTCAIQITMPFLNVYDPFNLLLQNIYFAFEFVFLVWLGNAERKKWRALCCSRPRKLRRRQPDSPTWEVPLSYRRCPVAIPGQICLQEYDKPYRDLVNQHHCCRLKDKDIL
ncbi:hypothetical protein BV898_12592 [Hypsibius exemplaris]|uniref:G-protein coupled receptors family 1 profile domain-containing protein n=1 Tax=Hypsibius exemplaris TaxID=2072580 RepID=A0A1W0WDB7_HYPEX|nr:hypothetical protein BV898_12592 [Hypsibius exemplaris]